MDCKLKHRYEVFDEGSHNEGMYIGPSARDAADKLRGLNHSPDFTSGAFVMATHPDRSFCREATLYVQDRAS